MCGRARCALQPKSVVKFAHDVGATCRPNFTDLFKPLYNIGPGQYLPIIIQHADGHSMSELVAARWGLVQKSTPDFFKMFNCRSESMHEKPSFRHLLSQNRCVVITQGFYEWKQEHFGKKQPYYVHFADADVMAMAGLYKTWVDESGKEIETFTIITTDSNKDLSWLHDRMPMILDSVEAMTSWLDPQIQQNVGPYHGERPILYHKVTPKMGKISFQGKECCQEYGKSQRTITSMFSKKADVNVSGEKRKQEPLEREEETGEKIIKREQSSSYI